MSINLWADGSQNASLVFNLDECTSYAQSQTNTDFSEFTANISNSPDVTLRVVGDHLYRLRPEINGHSCTPGANGTEAMCVSYDQGCNYTPNSERAVRFDIEVIATGNQPVQLQRLSFLELAPEMFDWIDGPSGLNNYPTQYGVRVVRDGVEIFRQSDLPTSTEWSLEDFSFFNNDDFLVDDQAVFSFELVAYCPVGSFAMQQVWDLENISIEAGCVQDCPSLVDGGLVSLANGATSINACVGDIVLDVTNTSLSDATDYYYVITEQSDNILAYVNAATTSTLDLSGAPPGVCHIWGFSTAFDTDPQPGQPISSLVTQDCEALSSNFITVNRVQPIGGTLTGGPFEFCVGDGVADNLVAGSISLSGNTGSNSQWVVTDDQGNILGLPPMPSVVDFDGAGPGTCLIWHLSFEDGLQGAAVGNNASDLVGCYSLSNPIEVIRNQPEGGTLAGGPFEFCVGDGDADNLAAGSITLSGNSGPNSQWVVTDDQGNILGLPPMPSAVDFDGAGPGTCLIWHLSFADGLQGAAVGNNASDLVGCYSLSNPITVNRIQPEGGTLTGGPFEFCVGDGEADNLAAGSITLSGNSGTNSQWVVTDDQGNILGLPPMPSVVDFDGAGPGTCLIWHLSFEDGLQGAAVGNNASDLVGCYSLSNPITVNRIQPEGGTLTGGPFEFCVGDGEADNLAAGSITLSGNSGTNSQWVVTDDQGNILGLPPMPSVVDFDGAGPGTCLIWHLSFEDGLQGAAVGNNASDLVGCYSLSNPITVNRIQPEGGTLTGGPFEFCVGDGEADNLAAGSITLSGNSGTNSQWVVTDDQGNILGLPPMPSVVDFDGAGPGTCLIWHLSFEDGLQGAAVGNNASDLVGCYSLSNPITVNRIQPEGGTLTGGPFEFCVGDGEADNLAAGSITLSGNSGTNSQWVVTDDQGNILGLPPMPSVVDFDGAGPGTCLIWHLSFEDGLQGAAVGNNASELEGCFSLSNPITVNRIQPEGGTLTGGPFTFSVGDGVSDNIPQGGITLSGNSGTNSQWVVTDDQGNILGLPPMPSAVDFEGAGVGVCLVWHLSFEDGLQGAAVGNNASDLVGCYDLSNPIEVNREAATGCFADGGTITGGPFSFTVGDGQADMIPAGSITLANANGANSQWVVTDSQGIILGLPPMPSVVDFDGAGAGNCLVWHLSYEGTITGLEVGQSASNLTGCFSLSNSITVERINANGCQANGGELFGGPFSFTVGDGQADMIPAGSITLANANGANSQWVVTDSQGIILGLPPMPSVVDFDGAGAGNCLVWHLSYEGTITGLEVGQSASNLTGCFSLSNSITVERINANGCQANGGELFGGPFSFTVGDGQADMIPAGSITLANANGANSQWVVTDSQGIILGLPPMPSVVDFDGAGAGNCLVWHLSYEGTITGLEVGQSASNLTGCFSLSNSITVERINANGCQANGGELFGGPFSFTVGDGQPDMIPAGSITLANANGANSQWVVTDSQGIILGLPPMPSVVDFDGAGAGNCLVWHLSYEGTITGLEVGQSASNLTGCFSLSNSITVERINANGCQANGGELFGGPFSFTVGDGTPDMIPAGLITLANANGMNSQWVVTDDQGIILGLPPMPSVVDFDGAGSGNCLVWHLSYEGTITGLEVGQSASNLMGCFSLSNSITVERIDASGCQANGGEIIGGPFSFTVGDGQADMIPAGSITLANANGANSQWVVTDSQGIILGLPPMPSVVDFDGAGPGTCLIWHLSYDGTITGLEVGQSANNLTGCWSLSNSIEVVRTASNGCQANGGELFGGPFSFTVGDGQADMIPAGSITLANANGANSQWIVTDSQGIILGLPPMPSVVDFDGAGAGNCLVWHLSYEGTITGLEVGQSASNLTGCFSLSNSITVERINASGCQANGGELFGGPFSFTVGDGTPDMIPAGSITLANANGMNSQWVVTDSQGIILGLPPMPSVVDFDGAGAGNCLVWHLSYEGTITGLEVGQSASNLTGCFSLSNSITVERINASGCQANGGELFGGPFSFTVGDGTPDMIPAGSITLANANGMNSQWVVTDSQGIILGLPPMPSVVDFDGAGPGTCLIWHLSYEGTITGLAVGESASNLAGCFSLSNSIDVIRTASNGCPANGGELFGGPFEFTVGDGTPDMIPAGSITLANTNGTNSQWVVTDDQGNILGLPPMPSAVDFDGAGVGTCLIWHLSYEDPITGLAVGENASNLMGCFDLSNSIEVVRIDGGTTAAAQVVINEINGDDRVELKNIGGTSIDISNYWLCDFPAYGQLQNLTIDCGGDLILDPGEIVTVVVNFDIDPADGEMGLYLNNNFAQSASIIDYVEWGSTGHNRASVAVSAGIWTAGDFVSAFTANTVIEYDGSGDASTDWSEDMATPCQENLVPPSPEEAQSLRVKIFPNPATDFIRITSDQLQVMESEYEVMIFDAFGRLVHTQKEDELTVKNIQIDISNLNSGQYYIKVSGRRAAIVKQFNVM